MLNVLATLKKGKHLIPGGDPLPKTFHFFKNMISVPREVFLHIAYHVQDVQTFRALRGTCRASKWACEQLKEVKQEMWKRVYIFLAHYPRRWEVFEDYKTARSTQQQLMEAGQCDKDNLGSIFSIQKQDLLNKL